MSRLGMPGAISSARLKLTILMQEYCKRADMPTFSPEHISTQT